MAGCRQSGVFASRTPLGIPPVALILPPDPQRPFEARTCAAAQMRHAEVQVGSVLTSQAEAKVRRLCDAKALTPASEKTKNGPKGM